MAFIAREGIWVWPCSGRGCRYAVIGIYVNSTISKSVLTTKRIVVFFVERLETFAFQDLTTGQWESCPIAVIWKGGHKIASVIA